MFMFSGYVNANRIRSPDKDQDMYFQIGTNHIETLQRLKIRHSLPPDNQVNGSLVC